ncbi:MAG TPA: PAS domain-containing protein [Abditibacteriaceae bacterium]
MTDFNRETRFQQFAENINQVLYVRDVQAGKILYVNPAYEQIWQRTCESLYTQPTSFIDAIHADDQSRIFAAIKRQDQGEATSEEYRILLPDGKIRWIFDRAFPVRDSSGAITQIYGIAEDVTNHRGIETRLAEQSESLEHVMRVGQSLVAELDLSRLVQVVTDAARELCDAQFGAFFYNVIDRQGERYTLYTLSGAPREAFANYPMPRATDLFGPTFRGEGTVRIDDVREDARYGKNDPHFGMPKDHLPVVSYLAVPVISRSGEVLGGLFYGHDQPGVFTEEKTRLVEHLATQAAVAVDNARLFEMVQREQALAKANEQDYKFLAESIPQIVWVSDASGALVYLNQRWCDFTGQDCQEGHSWDWQGALHPDDLPRCIEKWQQCLSAGEPFDLEYRLRRGADSVYHWHLGRSVPLRDASGKIIKWFGTATDIDDQKRSQEGLRFLADAGAMVSSSLDFRQTITSLAQSAVPALCDWCVIDVQENGSIKRLAAVHQDPEKVKLAYELLERYPPRLDEEIGLPYVLRTGQSQLFEEITEELLVLTAQDEEMLGIMRGLGLRSAMIVPLNIGGQTIGAMTLVSAESSHLYTQNDLVLAEEVARRAAEAVHNARLYREVHESLQKAKEAMRARDEFLAIVSHELKTPLTPILGWVSMLQASIPKEALNESLSHAFEVIERNVRSQSQLINDLLDVSRIVTGKLRLEVRPIELHSVIESAIETVQPALQAKSIELRTYIERQAGKIKGDPDRLQQVIWNLLTNAIKFTPKEGLVEVFLERVDSSLQITVRDTGKGIAAEFLPYVFDRFQQADSTTTRQYGGLGLGLSIVHHLTEMHGGTVSVESPGPDMGTTFRVRLPLLAIDELSLHGEALPESEGEFIQHMNSHTSRDLLKGLRILIVEDEDDARDMITAVLCGFGAEVQSASNVAAGLDLVQAWLPDILVSDIGMPGEDGYTFLRKVRALPPEQGGKTPAVALTAYARMEDRFKALSVGFQNHLAKPIEPAELAITIASTLGRTTGTA